MTKEIKVIEAIKEFKEKEVLMEGMAMMELLEQKAIKEIKEIKGIKEFKEKEVLMGEMELLE